LSIAIIHLSDIHVRSLTPEMEARFSAISAAVELSDSLITDVVILLTGDIADTGSAAEYAAAKRLLTTLAARLKQLGNIKRVEIFAIPGNHDCDLSGDQEIRELVIDEKLKSPLTPLSDRKLQICVEPQKEFFKFLSEISSLPSSSIDFQVAPRVTFELGGLKLGFMGLNTALFTKRHEQPGKLVILNRVLDASHIPECDILICAIHHPVNWLTYDCMDRLKVFSKARVDFMFSGHEHRRELFSKVHSDGLGTIFCEGGAFYSERHSDKGAFHICVIDPSNSSYKVRGYEWHDSAFTIVEDSRWNPLKTFKGRAADRLSVHQQFRAFINDPGAQYVHPRVDQLRLGDFLIPPYLKSLDAVDTLGKVPFALNETTISRLTAKEGIVTIFGNEKFGKTTLSKILFNEWYDSGKAPLYLDLKDLRKFDQTVRIELLEKGAKNCYSVTAVEEYLKTAIQDRILILDNFGLATLSTEKQRELIESFKTSFPVIVVLGNEVLKIQIASGAGFIPNELSSGSYEIQEFGYKARESLIRKWCSVGDLLHDDELTLERKVQRSMEMVEIVLGKNLLPSSAFFVLAVLQLIEADNPVPNSNSGSYGFIYEYLITQALARSRQIKDLNLKYSYLSELAYQMFSEKRAFLDESELRLFHAEYVKKKKIECDSSVLMADLTASSVLENRDGTHSFKYRYLFYYFVARFMAERFHEDAFKQQAFYFIEKLHNENNFNVLIFLVYLVKDPALKNAIVEKTGKLFSDCGKFDFATDRDRIVALGRVVDEVEFHEASSAGIREKLYEGLTKNAETEATEADSGRDIDELGQVNRAFKAIQLLGQTVKNFVGSMDGSEKVRFVETCYALGLRTIFGLMQMLEGAVPELTQNAYRKLLNEREVRAARMRIMPVVRESEVHEATREMVYNHAQMLCLSVIKKISFSIGSHELELVYDDIANREAGLSYQVIGMAIKLDHFRTLPRKEIRDLAKIVNDDPFVGGVVRRLVVLHFYLFKVSDRVRAEICSELNINFKKTSHLTAAQKKTK